MKRITSAMSTNPFDDDSSSSDDSDGDFFDCQAPEQASGEQSPATKRRSAPLNFDNPFDDVGTCSTVAGGWQFVIILFG
jgi:hypothetical protein